jgi:hypothetical protein
MPLGEMVLNTQSTVQLPLLSLPNVSVGVIVRDEEMNVVMGYVVLEATGRPLGFCGFYIRRENYRVWKAAETTKILNKKATPRSVQ